MSDKLIINHLVSVYLIRKTSDVRSIIIFMSSLEGKWFRWKIYTPGVQECMDDFLSSMRRHIQCLEFDN